MNEKNLLKEVLHLKILLHQKFANIKKKIDWPKSWRMGKKNVFPLKNCYPSSLQDRCNIAWCKWEKKQEKNKWNDW